MRAIKKPNSKLGLTLSTLYMAGAVYAVIYATYCSAFLCHSVLLPPALPWVILFGFLWSENPTPTHLFLFEVLLLMSFVLNAWIIYKIGKLAGRLFGGKKLP